MLDSAGRANIDELLSNPINIPAEFRRWLLDWLSINIPQIPISQIEGYKSTVARGDQVSDEVILHPTYSEHTWLDLDGPQISNLAAGTYFVMWGTHFRANSDPPSFSGGWDAQAGPSINGADPDKDITTSHAGPEHGYPGWRAAVYEVSGSGDNNEIHLEYKYARDGGAGETAHPVILNRWLTVLRIT